MAALVKVTDSLTGEPVIVNIDQAICIMRQDDKTIISFERDRICCTETPKNIYNAVLAQR